jgi:hypothetical protein
VCFSRYGAALAERELLPDVSSAPRKLTVAEELRGAPVLCVDAAGPEPPFLAGLRELLQEGDPDDLDARLAGLLFCSSSKARRESLLFCSSSKARRESLLFCSSSKARRESLLFCSSSKARRESLLGGLLPPGPQHALTALRDAQAGRLRGDMLVDGGDRFVGAVTLAMALGYDGHVSRYVGFLASYLRQIR